MVTVPAPLTRALLLLLLPFSRVFLNKVLMHSSLTLLLSSPSALHPKEPRQAGEAGQSKVNEFQQVQVLNMGQGNCRQEYRLGEELIAISPAEKDLGCFGE